MSWWIPGGKENGRRPLYLVGGVVYLAMALAIFAVCAVLPLVAWIRELLK